MKRTLKNGLVVLFLACCLAYSLATMPHSSLDEVAPPSSKKRWEVQVSHADGTQSTLELEEYVVGVVSAEMPASFDEEALKAQAVASRTYVLSRGLEVDDTTLTQVYLDPSGRQAKWQDDYATYEAKIEACVKATQGEVLTYEGQYISALFFSSSNGKTENNDDYFDAVSLPYLRSVDSSWDLEVSDTVYRQKAFTTEALSELFQTDQVDMEIISYKPSGRVDQVRVNDRLYSGREIRERLGLASSDFDIEKQADTYIFHTIGYGHGVGMSQYGALGMARAGYDYQEILLHYYQGVQIENLSNRV